MMVFEIYRPKSPHCREQLHRCEYLQEDVAKAGALSGPPRVQGPAFNRVRGEAHVTQEIGADRTVHADQQVYVLPQNIAARHHLKENVGELLAHQVVELLNRSVDSHIRVFGVSIPLRQLFQDQLSVAEDGSIAPRVCMIHRAAVAASLSSVESMQLRGQEAKFHREVQAKIYVERNHRTTNHCHEASGSQGSQPGGCFDCTIIIRAGDVACLVDESVGQIYHAVAEAYQKGQHGHLHWQKLDRPAAPIAEKSGQLKHAPESAKVVIRP
mmetsp:Transcript_72209/g.169216  ORF Transcript_72209/g.169216 Transcript_72209/m.169216 type:complete len:269 (-) Transcript_72209:493-1299(-)